MIRFFSKTRNQLAQRYVDALRAVDAAVEARITDPRTVELRGADGSQAVISLDSLKRECKESEAAAEAAIDRHVQTALRTLRPLPDEIDLASVLPLLKPAGWAERSCGVPSERPCAASAGDGVEMLVIEEVAGDLRFVAERHLSHNGVHADALRSRALQNLDALATAASLSHAPGDDTLWLASLPERFSFNATLALLPRIWESARSTMGDDVVCALPGREYCIFARAGDAETISMLRTTLIPAWHKEGAYPVAQQVFQLHAGQTLRALRA